jgi:hypothetical protein
VLCDHFRLARDPGAIRTEAHVRSGDKPSTWILNIGDGTVLRIKVLLQ